MLADGAVFRLMDTLLEVGPEGATREHILHRANLSTRTFYKYLKNLIRSGVIEERGSKYVLPLDLSYNFRFKQWRDLDRLYDQSELVRSAVFNIRDKALISLREELLCLWLVGSAARGEMKEGSDLDFLAIIKNKNKAEFLPEEGSFEAQWVPMGPEDFLRKLRSGDEFVVSAIRHGLILHDSGVAQQFYSVTPGSPSKEFFREKELVMERFSSRFFENLSFDELEDARTVLSSEAETILRSLLQRLGQSPAGKNQLLDLARIFLGRSVASTFGQAIGEWTPLEKTGLVQLHRKINNYYSDFISKSEHYEYIASNLIQGSPVELEDGLLMVLKAIFGAHRVQDGTKEATAHRADASIELLGRTVLIEAKALTGTLKSEHVRKCANQVDRFGAMGKPALGVLLYNTLREVPVLERPRVPSMKQEARKLKIATMSSLKLLELYLELELEGDREAILDKFAGEILLSLTDERSIAKELSESLLEIEAFLDFEEHYDEEVLPYEAEVEIVEITLSSARKGEVSFVVEVDLDFQAEIYAEAKLIDIDLSPWDSETSSYLYLESLKGTIKQRFRFVNKASATMTFTDLDLTSIVCELDIDKIVFSRRRFQERGRTD